MPTTTFRTGIQAAHRLAQLHLQRTRRVPDTFHHVLTQIVIKALEGAGELGERAGINLDIHTIPLVGDWQGRALPTRPRQPSSYSVVSALM